MSKENNNKILGGGRATGYPSVDRPWMKYYTAERAEFLHESMYECLVRSNNANKEMPALKYFGKEYTFEKMLDFIDRIASIFTAEGVQKNDRVIVLGLNTPEIICSTYAINKLGAIACMEYITQSEENLKKIALQYKAKYAVVIDNVYEKYRETLLAAGINTIFLARSYSSMPFPMKQLAKGKMKISTNLISTVDLCEAIKSVKKQEFKNCSKGEDIAVVLSTSGTTGIPKRAEITNDALNALAYQGHYVDVGMKVGATMLTPAPPFLAFGISLTTHMPLCNGTCLILSVSPDPEFVAKQFVKYKPNLFMSGHVFLDKIVSMKKVQKMDLSFVSAIELGGEKLSAEYVNKLEKFFLEHNYKGHMFAGYGMTELSACSTSEQATAKKLGTVGIPLSEVNFKIIDTDDGSELRYNEVGEMLVSSPCMMKQYFNNDDATKEIIEIDSDGVRWLHTGDLGKIDEDGFITVVGRIKRIELTIDPINNAQLSFIQIMLNRL